MKNIQKLRKLIRESLEKIFEEDLNEDYPSSFDIEYFKTLTSYNKRKQYCEEHLKRINSGSSRIVYKIDDEKVLKLAWNKKGLAQNEQEISYSEDYGTGDILANVFDYDENNLWLEMELVQKITKTNFQQVTGFSFEDFCNAVFNYGIDAGVVKSKQKREMNDEIMDQMWEDNFMQEVFGFIGNYGVPVGDFMRTSSWGLTKRNGHNEVVMIDFGLSEDVFNSYYN